MHFDVAILPNVNVDYIVRLESLNERVLCKHFSSVRGPPNEITSVEDVYAAIAYAVRYGVGLEYLVYDSSILKKLISQAPDYVVIPGGIVGHGAVVAARLRYSALVNIPEEVNSVLKFLPRSRFVYVVRNGEVVPITSVKRGGKLDGAVHLSIEFSSGVSYCGVRAPRSSRVILDFDTVNVRYPVSKDFLKVLASSKVDAVVVSGLHLVHKNFEDVALGNVDALASALKRVVGFKHLELGFSTNKHFMLKAFKRLCPVIDSIGFNFEEIKLVCDLVGLEFQINDSYSLVADFLTYVADGNVFHGKTLVIHDPYLTVIFTEGDVAPHVKACEYANAVTYCKLKDGTSLTKSCVNHVLKTVNVCEVSVSIASKILKELSRRGWSKEGGLLTKYGKYKTVVLPTRLALNISHVAGAGDTFAVAYSIEAAKQLRISTS